MRAGWQLTRVSYCRAGETLERRRRGVNAQRDPVGVDLILDEPMELVLDFGDTSQLPLPEIVKLPFGDRLEIPCIVTPSIAVIARRTT